MRLPARELLLFDWNRPGPRGGIEVHDETLRDGVQSPSVADPSLEEKRELIDLMGKVGVASANLGLPAAGPRAAADALALARHLAAAPAGTLPRGVCAGRTLPSDMAPIAEIQQRAGIPITAYAFIGSSPIRRFAEGWDAAFLLETVTRAVDFAVKQGLELAFVTEDTTRSAPEHLEPLFTAAVAHGASRLVLCDTVGHATPAGTRALVRWTRRLLERLGAPQVKLDWHGHNDRGLALTNTLAAVEAGIDRAHGCGLGVGERVGNAPLDLLVLNLWLDGRYPHPVEGLVRYVRQVAKAFGVRVPFNYPLAGHDAFRTATGVHAAAILKARKKGDAWLADRVYSGVPAGDFGKEQVIEIGHQSGLSNVAYWLERHGLVADEALCRRVLDAAKKTNHTMTAREVLDVVRRRNTVVASPALPHPVRRRRRRTVAVAPRF